MIRSAVLALGIICCLLPQTALAEDRCMEEGYLAHFEPTAPGERPRLLPQPCDEITTAVINWRGGSSLLRAVHPRSMRFTRNPAFVGRVREAADAIGSAMDRMGGYLNLDGITITLLLTNYVSPREVEGDVVFQKGAYIGGASSIFLTECPVSYYKGTTRATGADFVFTLAHEVFHCVQYRTWERMPDEDWLYEGSAEYFAYLAKPAFGPQFIPQFDREISRVPLKQMDYPAVVFYLWLGNAYGPPRVRDFLASTRSIESAVPPDMLSEFAKAYFAPTILMPNGRPMPSTPVVTATRTVNGSGDIGSPDVTPYTLKSELITFERNNVYELSRLTAPADARTAWRLEPGSAFGEMPTRISTCDGEKKYLVVRTTTTSNRAGDINVTAQPASSNVCACPDGIWRETSASARRYFEQSALGVFARGESTRYIGGVRFLVLNPDHTGSLTYASVETETTGSPDLTVRQIKTGGSHFTWTVANGELRTVLVGANNLITMNNELTTPSGVRFETRQAGAQSIYHRFSCDASGLHLRQIGEMPSFIPGIPTTFNTNMDFARVAEAP